MADEPRKPTKGRLLLEVEIPRAWIVGLLAALAVVVVLTTVGLSVANRIDSCASCHAIKPEVATYKHSAHYRAGVKCQQCHTKPGVFSYFIRNLEGLGNVAVYASGKYERPITAYVGADTCTRCHPKEQIEKDQIVGNIRVNHTGLREAGYQCLTCHANISHPGTRPEISRMSQNPMSICARCHNGKQLPDTCSTCHVGGAPAEEIDVPITGKVTPQQCAGCHKSKTFCTKCHNGLQMPHPAGFAKSHGQVVLDRGAQVCASCHTKDDPTFCIDCHGLKMPHPAGWLSQHDNVAAKDSKVCVKCHGANSCIRCHGLQMPHPGGWLSTHPSVARSRPATCTKCHSQAFCAGCHGVTLPHSSSFIANHPAAVYSNGAVCVKCHGNGGTGPRGCYGGDCHGSPVN
jgi:nitrate/TMAO reductase-like tetraheme cytochrome c subunit